MKSRAWARPFPQRIRRLLTKDGYSVKGLADRLEVSEATVRRWKKGPVKNPPPKVVQILGIIELS